VKQRYQRLVFKRDTYDLIDTINDILTNYQAQGYVLTVRQLYYQLVTINAVPNNIKSYKRVARIVNDGRLAGFIDWDMIEDRVRAFRGKTSWTSPAGILAAAESGYHRDQWKDQDCRVYVIVEKDALQGVLSRSCSKYDCPLLAARGYPSSSVLRDFVIRRVMRHSDQHIHIIHLGDHDPSGLDMTRDLKERIALFCNAEIERISMTRIALNMDQVEEKKPPNNPTKMTDSRVGNYISQYGNNSWELDALEPRYLTQILEEEISQYIDFEKWNRRETFTELHRKQISDFIATFKQ
jgi:hypothetical protein